MYGRQIAGVAGGATRRGASMIEHGIGKGRRAVAIATILRGLRRWMRCNLTGRAKCSETTAVARIASQAAYIAVIEQCRLGKCIGRNAMAKNTFRANRRWNMRRGFVFCVACVATAGDIAVIKAGADE